jgi:hypothetical protein
MENQGKTKAVAMIRARRFFVEKPLVVLGGMLLLTAWGR